MKRRITQLVMRLFVGATVTGVVVFLYGTIPRLGLVPSDVPGRFEATWMNPIFAVYASILAIFVVWRLGHRRDGQSLALLLGSFGLVLAACVSPTGTLDTRARVVVIGALTLAFVAALRFWLFFPRRMERSDVQALARAASGRSWMDRTNRLTARIVAIVLGSRTAKAVYLAFAAAFSWTFTRPGTYRYTPFMPTGEVTDPFIGLFGLPAVLLTVMFAWTAFRLAHRDERRRVLWIVLAQLTIGIWVSMAVTISVLQAVTGSAILKAAWTIVGRTYHPVTTFLNLTGYAVAIFYSGAFDLRPVLNRTTVFGAALVVLTFVFAGVEELVQSVISNRLNLPQGLGTWVGAAAVAVAMGPVRTKLEQVVKRVGSSVPAASDDPTPSAEDA